MSGTSYTDSPRGVLRSVGGQDYRFAPTYLRSRDPITPATSPDIKPKEQQGHYPVSSFWTNTVNQNVWVLCGIINNLAKWVLISSGGSGPITLVAGDDGVNVPPNNVTGVINLTGIVVNNATHAKAVFFQKNGAANTEELDVQVAAAIAASDVTKVGLAAFNNTEFTVDANGFVSLVGGGAALEQLTGDDAAAVVPTAGNINLLGVTVTNATHAKPVFFKKNAVSTEELDVQVTTTSTSGAKSINNAGLASFDSTTFSVDAATGFISMLHTPVSKVTRQVFTSSGTYTPTTGMLFCDIQVVGGGGGGGGCAATPAGAGAAGAGGGAGGYAQGIFSAATIGVSQTVTIGAAGAGGAAGVNGGGTGGTSSVGILITATGGTGGVGGPATANAASAPPGVGGTGTLGDFQTSGGVGDSGLVASAGNTTIGGFGGSSFYGGGAAPSATSAGNNAFSFGGGGGGASNAPSAGAALAGGNGAKGVVIITEYLFA